MSLRTISADNPSSYQAQREELPSRGAAEQPVLYRRDFCRYFVTIPSFAKIHLLVFCISKGGSRVAELEALIWACW